MDEGARLGARGVPLTPQGLAMKPPSIKNSKPLNDLDDQSLIARVGVGEPTVFSRMSWASMKDQVDFLIPD